MSKHICYHFTQLRFIFFILLINSYNVLICAASSSGDTPFARLDKLIKSGNISAFAAEDMSVLIKLHDADGNSLLHRAVAHRQINIAQSLIKSGATIDPINKKGFTPLDIAVMGKRTAFIECMIAAGADKSRALGVAVERNCPKSVKLLLAIGADPNGKGPDGKSALLEHAKICESSKVIPLLSPNL